MPCKGTGNNWTGKLTKFADNKSPTRSTWTVTASCLKTDQFQGKQQRKDSKKRQAVGSKMTKNKCRTAAAL